MSKGLFETVVDISAPGLPDKFPYLGCLPCGTRENTMDFVGAENSLRVQFATKQGWQYAQERALVRLSPPSRFLDRTFSTALRRAVIMEGQEKDCKVEYVTMHLEKGKLVFQNHDVPLYVWLPPVPEVAELAAGMNSNGGSENLGEFGLGYLLSALKDYLTEAGWVDEETLSIKKRQQDVRGQFLNKYHWFEHCNIPSHLFAVRGIAEFEHGVAAGFSCVEVQTNLLSHRSLVSQLENKLAQKQISPEPHATDKDPQDASTQLLKTVLEMHGGGNVSAESIVELRAKMPRTKVASLGGEAKKRMGEIKTLSIQAAALLPPEMKKGIRRKLKNLPDTFFCYILLASMFENEEAQPIREARKACVKWLEDGEVCEETIRLWRKKLGKITVVAAFILKSDQNYILEQGEIFEEENKTRSGTEDAGLHTL
jgi:hypothetical protein